MSTSAPPTTGAMSVSSRKRGRVAATAVIAAMIGVVGTVAAVAYWDEERESAAALNAFAHEQTTLARSLTAALGARLDQSRATPSGDTAASIALIGRDLRVVERPRALVVLLRAPGERSLRGTDGRVVEGPEIVRALDEGQGWLRFSPDRSPAFGLPSRTALGGLAQLSAAKFGKWGLAVLATAEQERDRERRARWRLILAVALAGGTVILFGGAALRRQRRELDLERELAITDLGRRRDEELTRTTRAATLGTLAMGIAHEISTPLGVIAGRAEQLLARVGDDDRREQAVEAILEQTARINQVIRAFLGLVRGDSPSERIAPTALVHRAMALCEHRFTRAHVELEARLPGNLPEVHGDPRLLEQALVNLLINACDACEPFGHVSIDVRNGTTLSFSIIDDGVGISEEAAVRALEPFFTTKPPDAGTGLGLAIVNEIAKHHRGSLALRARDPRGTIARLEIPSGNEPDARTARCGRPE